MILTRDIGGAIERYEKYKFNNTIYVVSSQQDLHLTQFSRCNSLFFQIFPHSLIDTYTVRGWSDEVVAAFWSIHSYGSMKILYHSKASIVAMSCKHHIHCWGLRIAKRLQVPLVNI